MSKLEKVLKPLELKTLLARFALYHYKYPIDKSSDSKEEISLKKATKYHQLDGTLMTYREMGQHLGTSHER